MDWHVNEGLAVCVAQMHHKYSGLIVGTIGDQTHQTEQSDHNPNQYGRVNAADFMIGGSFNADAAYALARVLPQDSRTNYVIYNHLIWSRAWGYWHPYTGSNPHTDHVHLSVLDGAYKNTSPWNINSTPGKVVPMLKFTVQLPVIGQGDNDKDLAYGYPIIAMIQRELKITDDGDWGPQTSNALGLTKMTEDKYRRLFGLSY